MTTYPVSLSIPRPERFERFHVVVRLLATVLLGLLGLSIGWTFLLVVVLLPAYAAVQSSTRGGVGYISEDGPRVASAIRWLIAAYAYLLLLTDRIPDERYAENISLGITPEGEPTPGSALWRLPKAIPVLLLMLVASILGGFFWLVAMVLVAISGTYPSLLFHYQEGVLRLAARLLVWDASLVESYPPLALRDDDRVLSAPHEMPSEDDLSHPHPA